MSKNPVLLIHGLSDTLRKFDVMTRYLEKQGWDVYRINLIPNYGTACLKELAHQVNAYINQTFPANQPIDLLGFSMGGMVTRYYLQRLGGIKRVQRYISMSAPNQGTLMAYTLPFMGVQQMCPNSEFLRELNEDHRDILTQIQVTVMWTPYDLMIVPAISSCMGIGVEKQFSVLFHAWMVDNKEVLEAVVQALSQPV